MRSESAAKGGTSPGILAAAGQGSQPGPASPAAPAARSVNSDPLAASNRKLQRAREAEQDRELVARAQKGDMGAFRQLVERHERRAMAHAMALVRDENDARELVQDAFVRVFKNLAGFEGQSSFYTWLYRIVTNLGIDLMRRPGRKTTELDEARLGPEDGATLDFPLLGHVDGSDPMAMVRRREIAARIQAALDALPPYHRAVILLREIDGLSYEEMAEVLEVSKGTIMSRLFHARQKLQRALADCYAEHVGGAPGPAAEGEP